MSRTVNTTTSKAQAKTIAPNINVLQKELKKIQSTVKETHEQVSFIYGVLEELAQRQDLQSHWQLDFARHMSVVFSSYLSKSNRTPNLDNPPSEPNDKDMAMHIDSVVTNIMGSIDTELNKITASRAKERIRGIRRIRKTILKATGRPEDPEPTLVVIPENKDEIH